MTPKEDISGKVKKKIVLAGNYEQFREYVADSGMEAEVVYGSDARSLMGIRASQVIIVGTFWERKDAGKLKELADSRIT